MTPLADRLWPRRFLLLGLIDFFTIFCIFMLSYYLRFYLELLAFEKAPIPDLQLYLKGGWFFSSTWVFLMWNSGGYLSDLRGMTSRALQYRRIITSGIYALGLIICFSFLFRDETLLSRQVCLASGAFSCCLMILWRIVFHGIELFLNKRDFASFRVVLAGVDYLPFDAAEKLSAAAPAIKIIGLLRMQNVDDKRGVPPPVVSPFQFPFPVLGQLSDIQDVFQKTPFDALLLPSSQNYMMHLEDENSEASSSKEVILKVLNFCEAHRILVYMFPGSFDVAVSQKEFGNIMGTPVIRIQDASLHPLYALLKHFLDFALALVGFFLTLPLWLLIAIITKATSKGPVIFTQVRVGLHGKPFKMYKFRSMVQDAEQRREALVEMSKLKEPVYKFADDPRVTLFGRFLRRTSLDELPQLINVLKGEMSLVGPRPEELEIVELYNPWQRRRLKARPGITGYQQVMNRGEPSLEKRIAFDLIYLKHQSLLFDLYILLRTIWTVVRGNGIT